MQEKRDDAFVMGRLALARVAWTDWVAEHGKLVLIASVSVLVVLFSAYQLIGKFGGRSRSDFAQAEMVYAKWVAKATFDPQLFKQLQRPLSSHPELHQRFGALIAQRLLSLNEAQRAHPFALAVLKRTEGLVDGFYATFSRASLLITEGKLKEALEEAKELKAAMEKDRTFWTAQHPHVRRGALLYAYNLLRIAMLEKEGGSPMGELLAWQELLKKAGWSGVPPETLTYDPEAYAILLQNFREQDVSLVDYIHERLKVLSVHLRP